MVWTPLLSFNLFILSLYLLYLGVQEISDSASFQINNVYMTGIRTSQLIPSLAAKLNFCTWASTHRRTSFLRESNHGAEGPAVQECARHYEQVFCLQVLLLYCHLID